MSVPVITRHFAMASPWTFRIKPFADLLQRYVGDGLGWADPFCGTSTLAEHRNDLDPRQPATHHMEAVDFAGKLPCELKGVLFDPPYSYRQVSEHYRHLKQKATKLDTSYNFYRRVMVAITPKLQVGGLAITFGWNTNGFGLALGFEKIEIMLVAHGLHHNDTICVVERRVS